MFYLVYLAETDGDIEVENFNVLCDLHEYVKKKKLHQTDFAIFKGSCIKGFD